jgi:Fur family ferric uptake transcriptional regulator
MCEKHLNEKRQFETFLKREGLPDLNSRMTVLDAFISTEAHATIKEISEILRERGFKFDREFIADTLRLFCHYGFAQKREFQNEEAKYEHRHIEKHHDHFICTKCGQIIEFYDPELEALQMRITSNFGFHSLQHKMEIYGLCQDCMQKREPALFLAMAPQGERLRVVRFLGGKTMQRRLISMGLSQGSEVEVLNNNGGGPVLVAVKGTRLAVGRGVAHKILLAPIRHEGETGADRRAEEILGSGKFNR